MQLHKRNRILRKSQAIRSLVSETSLSPNDFIVPMFITEGQGLATEITSMSGYFRFSLELAVKEAKELWEIGLKSVLLFVKCEDNRDDNKGTEALNLQGLMQKSIKAIKQEALDSAPGFGDKKTYQMDSANRTEAIRETLMDVEEGADIVMVKPALCYLDIISEIKKR